MKKNKVIIYFMVLFLFLGCSWFYYDSYREKDPLVEAQNTLQKYLNGVKQGDAKKASKYVVDQGRPNLEVDAEFFANSVESSGLGAYSIVSNKQIQQDRYSFSVDLDIIGAEVKNKIDFVVGKVNDKWKVIINTKTQAEPE